MTALLLSLLIAATPAPASPVDAKATFERLKKLEGAWKSKDAQFLTLRVVANGAALIETVTVGPEKTLMSVTVYRLDGAELVATYDGDAHLVFKLAPGTSAGQLTFTDKAGSAALTLSTKDADSLEREVGMQGKKSAGKFTREYVDTLK